MNIVKQPEKTLILRFHLADGDLGDEKFDLGYSVKGLVWYFHNEERYYTVDFRSLTEDVIAFRKEG